MIKKVFKKNINSNEGPIEAGQTLGMKPEVVLEKYLTKKNNILKLLRIYSKKSALSIANGLEISESELLKIENSTGRVPIQLVPRFANIFNIDLKNLLIILGHTNKIEPKIKTTEFGQLAFAARYSGPELTKQEKIDLEELFKTILSHHKKKSKEES